jgi:peptide/nickel transport system permease protein
MVSTPDRPGSSLKTILKRLLEGAATVWAAVTITFFALRIAGGDPTSNLLAQGLVSNAQAEELRRTLGLDSPLLIQYLEYLRDLIRGDLGVSLFTRQSVLDVILQQLPSTLELAITALIIAIFLGVVLGIISVWKKRTILGPSSESLSSLATALPVAFTGILALLLAQWLHNATGVNLSSIDILLPAIVLGIASAGPIAKVAHGSLEESIASPYIMAARARGIKQDRRLLWHALRPALPTIITLIALEAAFLFAGTVVTETVFSRPGLGRLLIQSILQSDFPVVQGIVILAAIFYTISHVFADLIAWRLDPRLGEDG